MSQNPTIAIVGSGPIGSAYARVLLEKMPAARVVMFEAGPKLTDVPGASVRNIPDADDKARAREMSQGPQAGTHRESLGLPAGTVAEGMFTARQGTHLFDFGGEGSAHAPSFPAGPLPPTSAARGRTGPAPRRRPPSARRSPLLRTPNGTD